MFPYVRKTYRRKICKDNTFLAKISKLLLAEIVLTESGIRPIVSEVNILCIFSGHEHKLFLILLLFVVISSTYNVFQK